PNEGDSLAYTLTLRNGGPDAATQIRVMDLLPAGLTYRSSAPAQGSYVPASGVWTVAGLASGGAATLGLLASVDAGTNGTTLTSTAAILSADQGDPNSSNNRDSVAVAVQRADLAVTLTVNDGAPAVGSTIAYTL